MRDPVFLIFRRLKLPTLPPPAVFSSQRYGTRQPVHQEEEETALPKISDDDMICSRWWRRSRQWSLIGPDTKRRRRRRATCLRRPLLSILPLLGIFFTLIFLWLYGTGHIGMIGAFMGAYWKHTTTLRLGQGTYLGEILSDSTKYPRQVQAFRGIPYAQSTAGNNRFRPPQPLNHAGGAHANDVIRALDFGNICPQPGGGAGQGEDCLNLNVYRPHFGDDAESVAAEMARQGLEGKKLPVVIYVHGGGFNTGCGKERNMGSFVAFADSPLIAISFNYRVGALGFLPSAQTAKEGLLNLGLKDQQLLFEWVRSNVADMGGDPNNVTIMGLSAGAHSIGHHLISYSDENRTDSSPPPFHKAIIESGGSLARAVFVPDHPLHEQQLQEFLMHCGLDSTPDDKIFDDLRSLPLSTITSAHQYIWNRWNPKLRWPFQPVIDGPGGTIPDLPINSMNRGNVLRIPILTGFNTNEGAIFVPQRATDPAALRTLMSSVIPALNKTDLDTMTSMYPDPTTSVGKKLYVNKLPSGFGNQFWRLDDAYAHYAYICPVLQAAHLVSTAQNPAPVYAYHYAVRSNAHGAADHADEAPLVAHDMDAIGKWPGVVATSDAMTRFWSRFIASGDPNLVDGPSSSSSKAGNNNDASWPKFVTPFTSTGDAPAGAGKVVLFGSGNDERMGSRGTQNRGVPAQVVELTDREVTECQFWFDRVILSQGFGNGNTSLFRRDGEDRDGNRIRIKAKL